MRNIIITSCLIFSLSLCGCTTKSNKIADKAFGLALKQQQDITHDLFTLVMQHVTDKYCDIARDAAASGNADAAAQAVKDAIYECDRTTWLTREQQTLTFELFKIPQRYIWEQRGWGSILKNDWEEAQLRVNADKQTEVAE